LEEAKQSAGEVEKGPKACALTLGGEEILVMSTGGKAGGDDAKGGIIYKYRFLCRGVEFLIHSNPSNHIQPVRVRYLAESLIGSHFFTVHQEFVLPFLKRLGLVIHADKPSRIDMQVMIDVPVSEFVRLLQEGHVVTKLRKRAVFGTMTRDETIELGTVSNAQLCIYDKGRELRAKKSNIVKEALFIRDCIGDEWYNSDHPITRIEIRLSRDALKSLGVDTVSDLQEREHAIVNLLTTAWFRILKDPKIRGHENAAAIHPIWERVRTLFSQYFTGTKVTDVSWNKDKAINVDDVAMEKQALGCLAKALAQRFGEQENLHSSASLANGWIERVQGDLHEKLNFHAEFVRLRTGIILGKASSYNSVGYTDEDDLRTECSHLAAVSCRKLKELERFE
jgi:hypothetical protein